MSITAMVVEPFQHDFMLTALAVAAIVGFLCALLGTLLVPRGLSLVGDGLAHGTLGGIGIGLCAGLSLSASLWLALPFSVCVALGITWLQRRTSLANDAVLGVFFSVAMAVGIATIHIASRTRGLSVDLEAILFGNILATDAADARVLLGICIGVLLVLLPSAPRIAYGGFYPDLAAMRGIRVARQEYLLMLLAAVATVTAVRVVGTLLVSAYLIIPAVAARQLSRRLGPIIFIAVTFAMSGSVFGLLLSYHLDIPTGSAMTLTLGATFILVLALRALRDRE